MIPTLSNWIAELSLRTTWHVTHVARDKRSMCCMWFAHDCARATSAYVLETIRGAVRRLSKISNRACECDYYYYFYRPPAFQGLVISLSDFKTATSVAILPGPGVLGSIPRLADQVSVYCYRVKKSVWTAASISIWQHAQSPEQIRPRYTLEPSWELSNQHIDISFLSPNPLKLYGALNQLCIIAIWVVKVAQSKTREGTMTEWRASRKGKDTFE